MGKDNGSFVGRVKKHIKRLLLTTKNNNFRDVLFVWGTSRREGNSALPNLVAYQKEQLELLNFSVETVSEQEFEIDSIRYFQCLVFWDCNGTVDTKKARVMAKQLNKVVITRDQVLAAISEEQISAFVAETTSGRDTLSIMKNAKLIANFYELARQENVGFVLPGLKPSGGIRVALKHASLLQRQGKDVSLFVLESDVEWYQFEDSVFPVIDLKTTNICGRVNHAIATMWTTLSVVEQHPNFIKKSYLVQGFETDFYGAGDPLYVEANRTYSSNAEIKYVTISRWCQQWLWEVYGQEALYVRNGLDVEKFGLRKRDLNGKVRLLIEGDCEAKHKNVDEAFRIVELLDPDKYEVWYMSYNGQPKEWYRVDNFLHEVPYAEVAEVYEACDILLKTSLLESFSYPPMEMMATGGYVVAVPNGGNAEYLVHGKNCMLYSAGQIHEAKKMIEDVVSNEQLQDCLYHNGRRVAEMREWKSLEGEIVSLYD